jgi:hypothetical protein
LAQKSIQKKVVKTDLEILPEIHDKQGINILKNEMVKIKCHLKQPNL